MKYKSLPLMKFLVRQRDRSRAIDHWLNMANGNTVAAYAEARTDDDLGHRRFQQRGTTKVHAHALMDAQEITEELLVDDPLVLFMLDRLFELVPLTRGVKRYMDDYVRGLDGDSYDSS